MILRGPLSPGLAALFLLAATAASALDGYRVYESTVASVDGEVLFLSDIAREDCFLRCAAMPGSEPEILTRQGIRDRLIHDVLVLQEQKKLLLGLVDNAALSAYTAEAVARMAACESPCKADIRQNEIRPWVERKLVIRDFLNRRVGMFVEVSDEDVEREVRRRTAAGGGADLTADQVREEMREAKMAQEVKNWYDRTASKARIVLSPLEEK